jgi:cell pole-organizing protein PopZ
MEEILSSIKRIIAEDKAIPVKAGVSAPPEGTATAPVISPAIAQPDAPIDDDILELTDAVAKPEPTSDAGHQRLIDDAKLAAMRDSLEALATMGKVDTKQAEPIRTETSLEELTRDLLRPMLKNWLDTHLPALVEEMVAKEIQRISRK